MSRDISTDKEAEKRFVPNDPTAEDLRPTPEQARLLGQLSLWEKHSRESMRNKPTCQNCHLLKETRAGAGSEAD